MLIILTTPWNGILLALRWFRLPAVVVDILGMTYRYIFLFLHTTNSMFLARRSRSLGTFSGAENRRWLAHTLVSTMAKSQHLSEEVYLAMLARGYQGEIYHYKPAAIKEPGLYMDRHFNFGSACFNLEHISMNNTIPDPIFEVRDLSYHYAGNIPALNRINFTIYSGQMVALVGANGSGKSTLLKLMDGLVFPTQGEIRAFGHALSEKAFQDRNFVKSFRQRVGLVFQDPDVQLFSSTVWDEVTFGPLQLRIPRDEVESRGNKVLELLNIRI